MEGLKHEPHALGTHSRTSVFIESAEIGSVQPHLAGGWFVEAGQEGEECGFPGARRADDGDRISSRHVKIDGCEDGQRPFGTANLLAKIFGLEDARFRHAASLHWPCLAARRGARRVG